MIRRLVVAVLLVLMLVAWSATAASLVPQSYLPLARIGAEMTPVPTRFGPPTPIASPTSSATPTTTANSTPTDTPTTTATSTTTVGACTVPNFIGTPRNQASSRWANANFIGTLNFQPGMGNYTIGYQSIPAGMSTSCSSAITVGP
jgi:hypothetical protein